MRAEWSQMSYVNFNNANKYTLNFTQWKNIFDYVLNTQKTWLDVNFAAGVFAQASKALNWKGMHERATYCKHNL